MKTRLSLHRENHAAASPAMNKLEMPPVFKRTVEVCVLGCGVALST
jgi:hypothetical protein